MISHLSALPIFVAFASAQYNIKWYSNPPGNAGFASAPCSDRFWSTGCTNIPAFECCEAPMGRENFIWAKAFSGGSVGVLVFHDTDRWGGCLGCTTTKSLNQCYSNVPFEPASILPITRRICQTIGNATPDWMTKRNGGSVIDSGAAVKAGQIVPGTGGNASIPAVCNKINTATIDGVDYHMEEGHMNEKFMGDFHGDMGAAEFVKKYGLKTMSASSAVGGAQHVKPTVGEYAGAALQQEGRSDEGV